MRRFAVFSLDVMLVNINISGFFTRTATLMVTFYGSWKISAGIFHSFLSQIVKKIIVLNTQQMNSNQNSEWQLYYGIITPHI